MRAQNEPPETVVRLVRGDPPGEPTDIPGAYRVDRVDEEAVAEGRVWPQSRGSQLAGLAVGAATGERTLDLCAAPGGKATQARRRGRRGRAPRSACARAEENVRRLRATRCTVVHADATRLPSDLTGFDRALVDAPCSGLGVLAARPDLRWRGSRSRSCSSSCSRRRRAREARRDRPLLRLHDARAETEEVVDASGLAVDPPSPTAWPQFRHPPGRSSSRPCRTSTARAASSSPGYYRRLRRMGWNDWIRDRRDRAVALRSRLRAARRADRTSLARRAARLPLRRRRRALRPAGHDRAGRARSSIAPLDPRAGGVIDCHLMVSDPAHHFPSSPSPAATGSPSTSRRRTTRGDGRGRARARSRR